MRPSGSDENADHHHPERAIGVVLGVSSLVVRAVFVFGQSHARARLIDVRCCCCCCCPPPPPPPSSSSSSCGTLNGRATSRTKCKKGQETSKLVAQEKQVRVDSSTGRTVVLEVLYDDPGPRNKLRRS